MKKDQLARLLAAAVAFPASMMTAGCECPHDVVVETEDQKLEADEACEAATTLRSSFDPYGTIPACGELCGDAKFNNCRLDEEYMQIYADENPYSEEESPGVSCPAQGATITCEVLQTRGTQHALCPIPGRRPAGLSELKHDPSAVGRFLASSAYFEAAAVIAFERLAAELAALGAPEELLFDLARAARDEVRHAAAMSDLAARHGAAVEALDVTPATARSAEEIAIENAVEGLVNETFAAATARFQAEHAEDPQLRAAMLRIADDECAHAALAFRIAAFLEDGLDAAARARVESRRRAAIRALPVSFKEPSAEVRRLLGVPTRAEAMAVYRRICACVWGIEAAVAAAPGPSITAS